MPRPRRASRTRRQTVTEGEVLWAYDQLEPDHPEYLPVVYMTPRTRYREVWEEMRAEVVESWVAENPGTRPPRWWKFDAPEQRRQLGGSGTPVHRALAYVPEYARGIPTLWVSASHVEYYNGRARDIHGNAIGDGYSEGDFLHKAIDPDDPPLFESEATYLDRLGLLTDGERAQLAVEGWPEPEAVTVIEDDRVGSMLMRPAVMQAAPTAPNTPTLEEE